MTEILLIKTGDTFPGLKTTHGDFEDMITTCLQHCAVSLSVYDARSNKEQPNLLNYRGVILTGSHAMVTACEPWSESLLPYIRQMHALKIPVFAICYGHQLVAKALGGEVGFHPLGPEPGTVEVTLTPEGKKDLLLGQAPASFKVNVAHSQTVLKLPLQALILAENNFEPHQAFRIGNIWAVQFHPEFNREITQYYVRQLSDEITAQHANVDNIYNNCQDTHASQKLLTAFVENICSLPQTSQQNINTQL